MLCGKLLIASQEPDGFAASSSLVHHDCVIVLLIAGAEMQKNKQTEGLKAALSRCKSYECTKIVLRSEL